MGRLLATIISISYNWNLREFRRFRNCALAVTVLPLGMLLGAAALGGIAWQYKLIVVELTWLLLLYATIVFGWRRLPFVVEAGTLLAASDPEAKDRKLTGDVRVSIEDYLQLIMSVLASETAAGFITLWLPVHANVPLALLGLPIGMAFIAYWIWQGGELWWPRVVLWVTVFTLVAALMGLTLPYYLPQTTSEAVSKSSGLDRGLAAVIRGDASPFVMFWAFVVLFIAIGAGVYLVKEKARRPVRWAGLVLLIALFVSWLLWGAGRDAVESRVGETRPAERFISIPLQAGSWSRPVDIPPCTGWEVYPEPGQTVWVAAADDGYRKEYRYSPTETPQVPGRGPFRFRGEGQSLRVSLLEPGTYCYQVPKQARTW